MSKKVSFADFEDLVNLNIFIVSKVLVTIETVIVKQTGAGGHFVGDAEMFRVWYYEK
jgi:hypothetical protein